MAVEKSLEILLRHKPGYRASCRGFHFTGALPQLGRYELQAKGLIERLLVRSRYELTSPPQRRAGQGKTFSRARVPSSFR